MIEVLSPGPLSSLQDLGRHGFQRYGVGPAGAMDEWSHRLANLLVGNALDAATLEITLLGPTLRFHQPALIAITGADFTPRLDEQPVALGWPLRVVAGSQLAFGRRRCGARAYLAVRGGYAVAPVMGSRSTALRAGFGGFEGRALRKGDRLTVEPARERYAPLPPGPPAGFPPMDCPSPGPAPLRLLPGQQWAAFSTTAQQRLLGEAYVVHRNSDRMGYRLSGPALALVAPLDMVSEPVAFGTVQVPPDGQPIVLMADRQTTGGYPKIASVIGVDLPRLAQAIPGDTLCFTASTLAEARALDAERELTLRRLQREMTEFLETDECHASI